MLDETAWLYNLRGRDIPYNPVFFSYAVVTEEAATLYINHDKLTNDVKDHLGDAVHIRPYESLLLDLTAMSESARAEKNAGVETGKSSSAMRYSISTKGSWALSLALGGEEAVDEIRSPVADAKAVKNETELGGMRACHIRDGAALIEFFAWLEEALVQKGESLDEVQAADQLERTRSKHEHFVGLSFDTISSTGPNAAVIHYKPEKGACATIDPKAVYLCDSGAQYLDGTTDTTRTMHFGTPSDMEIEAYTLVLKGVIALDRAIFPKGISGMSLDSFARQHLWRHGLDYRHGTGHGVGSFLVCPSTVLDIGIRMADISYRTSMKALLVLGHVHNTPRYSCRLEM